ncbi:MAG: rhomboid family intramembrane serine protease [Chryseobacterium sp.]|nr:MAG: rhomboid family intramembrane serine protease [Chryseobacterium sp.]
MIISGVDILVPENQDLIDWGANFRPITLAGEWWRLFTACFLHIGVLHLLLNMYALLYIGLLLEPYLGKTRFLAAYLLCGIMSSMASLWWNDMTISAGASGAIFGMYGVFIALLTTNLVNKAVKNSLMTSVGFFVVYNIIYGLKPGSNIDNAAHIGGLLSGLVIGYSFVPGMKQYENKRIKFLTIGIVTFLLLTASSLYYRKLSGDMKQYEEGIEKFVSMEAMALEVFSLPQETSKEAILKEFRSRGIYYWGENIKLIESFKELDLPASITSRNSKLKEYCTLRVESYQLMCRAIVEETNQYDNELEDYNQKIQFIMDEIKGK